MKNVKRGLVLCLLAAPIAVAIAKLPPLSDEAKSKAAEAAAKTAWGDKVAAFQLCQSQDKVAAKYRSSPKAAASAAAPGAPATSASAPVIAACVDPGPFQSPVAAAPAASGASAVPQTTAAALPASAAKAK